MAVRPIVLYKDDPDTLRKVSEPVDGLDPVTANLVRDLKDTLNDHPDGIGLAAPQIGVHRRVILVRLGAGPPNGDPSSPMAILNPEIIQARDDRKDHDGCLSFPGLYGMTVRPHHLVVRGLDGEGASREWTFDGFDAVVTHHEVDHLNGVLFIDRVKSPLDLYMR